jgi:hypothetical protein
LRTDGGAGGSVPALTQCREAGLPFVTRLARYEVLAWPEVVAALARATWCVVTDSGSGPRREAAELGTLRLAAGQDSMREDGRPYAPLEMRVVVSRFPASARKRGAGVVQDGWHYELYATDLPAPEWPADEVVTCYYGRCGQENRFHQEDEELELGRIFNYTPAGQELANLVGLLVWNQGICRGLELSSPLPKALPPQSPRTAAVTPPAAAVSTVPCAGEREAAVGASLPAPPATATLTTCSSEDDALCRPPPDSVTLPAAAAGSATTPSPTAASPPPDGPTGTDLVAAANTPAALKALCVTALLTADWSQRLAALPGWRYDALSGLRCLCDRELRLHSAAVVGSSVAAIFRARPSVCRDCPSRPSCTSSSSASFCKEISLRLPLASLGPGPPIPAARVPTTRPAQPCVPPPPRLRPSPGATQAGPLQSAPPALLPSVLRHRLVDECATVDVHVNLTTPGARTPRRVDYYSYSRRQRQHRRLTWNARFLRNELPDKAVLELLLVGGQRLNPLLRATN